MVAIKNDTRGSAVWNLNESLMKSKWQAHFPFEEVTSETMDSGTSLKIPLPQFLKHLTSNGISMPKAMAVASKMSATSQLPKWIGIK